MNNDFLDYIRANARKQDKQTLTAAFDLLRNAGRALDADATYDFRPGDKVSFEGRWGATLTGKVTKVNRSTVSVNCDDGQRWRVRGTSLTKVTA